MATNGQDMRDMRTSAELTADVVKRDGLDLAQNIRALAEKARKEGEALASYAEEKANEIIQASEIAAARIAEYLQKTAEARESVKSHHDTLSTLPEPRDYAKEQSAHAEGALGAIEKALSNMAQTSELMKTRMS